MTMRRLLIDTSNQVWLSLLSSRDNEFGVKVMHEGKEVRVNGWKHGYEIAINHLVAVMKELDVTPNRTIFAVEGQHSKTRREMIYPNYKKGKDSRPPAAYEQFNLCKSHLLGTFRNLGAQVVTQDGVEGDDVLAYLCKHLDGEKVVLTTDGDLATTISESTSLWRNGQLTKENPYGPFSTKYIPVYKALVGDGAEYKGAHLFGPKAFLDFLVWAGESGLAALEGMLKRKTLHELADDVDEFKPLKRVIDSAQHVYESYQCALLHDEWVDTLRQPLEWSGGIVKPTTDTRLAEWGQKVRLVTAQNYDKYVGNLKAALASTPVIALDIETSTPEASDDWLRERGKEDAVDVFGSELTGLSLTYGSNGQHTIYISVDHADTDNCTSEQARDLVALIPITTPLLIHNVSFELPILYQCWGEYLKDNGWHGFLPNALDTAMMSSYVDENRPQGLKDNSKNLLGYTQVSYKEVTTLTGATGELPRGGMLLNSVEQEDGTVLVTKQYKMCELSAEHVLNYGADDAICTMGLYHHFRTVMEIEKTWDVFLKVEQKASYLKALAYTQGVNFSLERMKELEAADQATIDSNWAVIREFLIEKGWTGTRCPVFEELTPANIKLACKIILGVEFKTMTRTPSKMAKLMLEADLHPEIASHDDAEVLSQLVANGAVDKINDWMQARFSGEPVFDQGSPKEMATFLYDVLGLPIRLVNKPTPTEWHKAPLASNLVANHLREWAGYTTKPVPEALWVEYCKNEGIPYPCDKDVISHKLLKSKAKSDDKAILFALELDTPNNPILKAFQAMKTCNTRQTMFYNAYRDLRHWKDNKIHGQSGQCRAVTRRDTPNGPNLAQLPKKGEGVKFRECFEPHKKGAVVVSLDFSGQELRHGAAQSRDPNMLACFIGDHKKDIHSLTASGAMAKKWGTAVLTEMSDRFRKDGDDDYDLFLRLRKCKEDPEVAKKADDLRKVAKNVNFLAQYDGQAPKLAGMLIITVEDAQTFLDAKYKMFPRYETWKDEVKAFSRSTGYVKTPMGARRHLRNAILSDEKWIAEGAMRQGPNFVIQGGSGEQTKLAQGRLWDSGLPFRLDMQFYFSVHDELVFSVAIEDAVEAIKAVHDFMVVPYGGLEIPFLASISLGPNFGEQYECGDWFIRENIEAALAKVVDKTKVTV